jgi:ankyrin repeat protein
VLLNFGTDSNIIYTGDNPDYKGFSLLHFAVFQQKRIILSFLLDHLPKFNDKMNLNIKDSKGRTPKDLALEIQKHKIKEAI